MYLYHDPERIALRGTFFRHEALAEERLVHRICTRARRWRRAVMSTGAPVGALCPENGIPVHVTIGTTPGAVHLFSDDRILDIVTSIPLGMWDRLALAYWRIDCAVAAQYGLPLPPRPVPSRDGARQRRPHVPHHSAVIRYREADGRYTYRWRAVGQPWSAHDTYPAAVQARATSTASYRDEPTNGS